MEASRAGAGVEDFGGTASATDPFLVRAVPLQAKPLPLGQLQLIQSFLHVVPQGRKMVDEVSWGLGAVAVEGWALLHWWGLFLPCTAPFLENHSFPFSPLPSPLSFSGPAAHLPSLPWSRAQVDRAIAACAELHDLKEVVLGYPRKLEGTRPESPAQVRPAEGLLLPESRDLIL